MLDHSDLPRSLPPLRPDPSCLAYELFDQIIGFVTDWTYDLKSLLSFSRVSKQWKATVQPRMYSKWEYDGQYHSITSLWQFLRTIIGHRELADSLRIIHIRTWTLGLVRVRGGRGLTFSDHDLGKLKDAIHTAGLQRLESRFMEALQKADPRPLMALLLAHARKLEILYAELPETDIFFAEVLRKATEDQHDGPNGYYPLHNLREAYLASSWNYGTGNEYKLKLSTVAPIFHLPNVQTLSVFDFESQGASIRFKDCSKSSSITDLTLVHHSGSGITIPDAKALLAIPKNLTNLSIHLNCVDFPGKNIHLSNLELWDIIREYTQSMKSLDIHRAEPWFGCLKHEGSGLHFGPMKEFKLLRRLCIQPNLLLGDSFQDPAGPLKLVDALPPNLRMLTAYLDKAPASDNTIGYQLRDVVTGPNFPHLTHVVLENNFKGQRHFFNRTSHIVYVAGPLHDYVERACMERGIKFEATDGSFLTKGGKEHSYYQKIEQNRARMIDTMDETREVITGHLTRLRGVAGEDAQNQTNFTIDDLDDFELPWKEFFRMRVRMRR